MSPCIRAGTENLGTSCTIENTPPSETRGRCVYATYSSGSRTVQYLYSSAPNTFSLVTSAEKLKSDITNVFALSQLSQELELGLPSHTRFAMLTLQLPVRWKERPNSDTQCIHMYKKLPVRAMLFLYAHFDIPSIQADL